MLNAITEIENRDYPVARNHLHSLSSGPERPAVVAVIPAYNEERFIASVVMLTREHVDTVIVVDDGSTDKTALLADLAGAEVIRLPRNHGKGQALNAGFERAQELRPGVVVMLDADAQHDPDDIQEVIRPVLAGDADVVIGSRFLGQKSDIPGWRRVGQHALTAATNRASGLSLSDSQSGFRAFSLDALSQLHFESSGLAVESEMQFVLERSSLVVTEAPISVQYRDGNKRNPLAHGIQVLDAVLSLVARRRPLLVFGLASAVCLVVGLMAGVAALQATRAFHVVPLGTVVFCALFLIFGLMLAVTGVILNTLEHFLTVVRAEMQRTLTAKVVADVS